MWGAIAGLVVYGISQAIGAASAAAAREQARKQAREQAEYQRKLAIAQRDTALGKMELQMEQGMNETYTEVNDARGARTEQSTMSGYSTFLGEQAGQAEYLNQVAAGQQTMGDLNAAMGSSGARADVNLQTVIDAGLAQDLATKKQQVQGARIGGVYQLEKNARQYTTQINRGIQAYDPGNALMRSYEYNKLRLNYETDLTVSYLDDVIKANQYNSTWFLADALGFLGAGAQTGSYAYDKFGQSSSYGSNQIDAVSY